MTLHHTKGQIAALKDIPPEKLGTKVKKTVLGVGVTALSVVAVVKWQAPWWAGMGGGLLGATIWSGELVTAPFKLLGAAIVDLYKQYKG